MEISSAFLGSIPPALAALAELWTPVKEHLITDEVRNGEARQVARQCPAGATAEEQAEATKNYEEDVQRIAKLAGEVAYAASKVSMPVPTWIGFVTGFTAILIEFMPQVWALGVVVMLVAVTALGAAWFFAQLKYHALAAQRSGWRFCGDRLGSGRSFPLYDLREPDCRRARLDHIRRAVSLRALPPEGEPLCCAL